MKKTSFAKKLQQYAETALILDTETTGLDPDDEVIEIALIDMQGNTLLNTTVKPSRPYGKDNEAAKIHGIPYESLLHSPSWPDVQEQLLNQTRGRPILIYNAAFDTRLMNQSAYLHDYYEVEYNAVCMMKLYSEWFALHTRSERRRHRLIHAAEYCGVAVKNAHRALDDCLTTLGVFRHMLGNSAALQDDYLRRTQRIKTEANPNGHLSGHTVVITGDLSRPRAEIQQLAADAGCKCTTSVSPKTTILLLGTPDLKATKGKASSKEQRARELQAAGHPIRILNEAEFMQLLQK